MNTQPDSIQSIAGDHKLVFDFSQTSHAYWAKGFAGMSEGFVDGSFTEFNDRDLPEACVKKNYSQHLLAK